MKIKNWKLKIRKKSIIVVFGIVAVLAITGTVLGLNGFFGGGGSIPSDTFTRGLVGYWSMDEGKGTTTADISGNNNTGIFITAASSPAWTQGKVNGGLSFDGTDNYAQATVSQATTTVSMWVQNSGVWEHVVNVNGTTYVNGAAGTPTSYPIYFSGTTVQIGKTDATTYFTGLIDEVRIYNRALTAEEIRYHYNRGGPVGYWKFDEGNGTTTYDSSGTGNTGQMITAASSPTWVSGKYGSALNFDGVNDYVNAGNAASLNITDAITIESWVKTNSFAGPTNGRQKIVSKRQAYSQYIDNADGDSKGRVQSNIIIGGEEKGAEIRNVIAIGEWYHLAFTYNGSSLKIYVNGILGRETITTGDIDTIATKVEIGRTSWGAPTYDFFNGLIDDVRIYNYARTADEIKLDYNAGFAALFGPQTDCDRDPGSCMTKGLVGQWSMDEGRGTTTADISGNNNTGIFITAASSPAWTRGAPALNRSGTSGSGLSFDGTNDKVAIPDADMFDLQNMTMEAWIKPADTSINHGIVGKWASAVANRSYSLLTNNASILEFYIGDGITTYGVGTQTVTTNWTHLVGTYDGATQSIYINGVLNQAVARTITIPVTTIKPVIGTLRDEDSTWPFKGLIDEVRIYNRALSAAEIRYHYNRGGPVGYWKFDEGSGTTTYDGSGNNNTGQMLTAAGSPAWVSGKYGTALNFDGVDDFVDMTGISSSTRSISFWLNRQDTINRDIIDLGTAEIKISSNTITSTGFTSPAYYVDGAAGTALKTGVWQHVVITSTADVDAFNVDIGKASTNYFSGMLDDMRIYNYARTQEQILQDYNAGYAASFGPQTDCDRDPGSCMTKGLVGQWSMDEGRGTTTADISGNNNTGIFITAASSPAWTRGAPCLAGASCGGGLRFDGTNDYVQATHPNITAANTVEAWVKLDASSIYASGVNLRPIVSAGSGWSRGLVYYVSAYTPYGMAMRADTEDLSRTAWVAFDADGLWHHWVGTWNGTRTALYKDGVLVDVGTVDDIWTNDSSVYIMGYPQATRVVVGSIDEVRIYNRALSATEVRYHYNRGGPVAYWKFDEGSGTTTYDGSGNGNTGQMITAAGSPTWVSGKYGTALSFDGTDDYVETSLNLLTTSAFSIEGWVKGTTGTIISQRQTSVTFNYLISKLAASTISAYRPTSATWITGNCASSAFCHFTLTYDGKKLTFYVDAILVSSVAETNGYQVPATTRIGGDAADLPVSSPFNGLIDDVRIYNYARTQEQIFQDYNQGKSIQFK